MQKNKQSGVDLHNIHQDIYLGYLSQQPLQLQNTTFEISYFGGQPIWLKQPKQKLLLCNTCITQLSFLGQIYCPFEAPHCYHRVLYFLVCEKCLRQFRCIRQQQVQGFQLKSRIKTAVNKLAEPRQIENDSHSKNEFIKLMNRLKIEIEQEKIIQQADSEEQDQKQIDKQLNSQAPQKQFSKYQPKQQLKQESKKVKQQQEDKDINFEVYKKAIVELNNPCMLYTDVALSYNSRPLNPQHFCRDCGSKLKLQVQITQQILNMKAEPSSKLLFMDWGAIMVYTCSSSCQKGSQQCVVVQYQINAVTQQDIKKLKKNKKNRKKKQKKSKSKSKSKSKQKDNANKQEVKQQSQNSECEQQNIGEVTKDQKTQQQDAKIEEKGDWD